MQYYGKLNHGKGSRNIAKSRNGCTTVSKSGNYLCKKAKVNFGLVCLDASSTRTGKIFPGRYFRTESKVGDKSKIRIIQEQD